jgi:protein-S-isoprenylcysteine O-methyltransferase Ste14
MFDRIYYMRAVLGVIGGIVAGLVIVPGTDQGTIIGIVILIGLFFYFISYGISKKIGRTVQKPQKRKLATNGIFPFIFLLLMFMIIIYTGLHQSLAR